MKMDLPERCSPGHAREQVGRQVDRMSMEVSDPHER